MDQQLNNEKVSMIMEKHNITQTTEFNTLLLAVREGRAQNMEESLRGDLEEYQGWLEQQMFNDDNPHLKNISNE